MANIRPTPRANPTWYVYAVMGLVPFFWAGNFIASKIVLNDGWNPLGFMTLRFSLMSVLACALALGTGESLRVQRKDWGRMILAGACGYGIYQLIFIVGLSQTTAFASSLLNSTFPIFVIVFGTLFGIERAAAPRWIGAAVAMLGVAIFEGAFNGAAHFRLGDLLMLGTAILFSLYMIVIRGISGYGARSLLAITMTLGTLIIIPFGISSVVHQNYGILSLRDWLLFGYTLIFPILIGYLILNWAIARIGTGAPAMYGFAVPVISGFGSVLFLGAPIEGYEIVGSVLCIAGMVGAEAFSLWRSTIRARAAALPIP